MSKISEENKEIRRKRLKEAIEMTGLSQAKFALAIGWAPGDVSKARSGANNKYPTDGMCIDIANSDNLPGHRFLAAWLMGESDIPTEEDMKQVNRYYYMLNKLTFESHITNAKRNLLAIIRTRELYDKDIGIKATSENEDFSDFIVSINDETVPIPVKDFAILADDVESYAIHRINEYIKAKKRGYF